MMTFVHILESIIILTYFVIIIALISHFISKRKHKPVRTKAGIENAVIGEKILIEYGYEIKKATVVINSPKEGKILLKVFRGNKLFRYYDYNFRNFDILNPVQQQKQEQAENELAELKYNLKEALRIENYERAAQIREQLKKIKQ